MALKKLKELARYKQHAHPNKGCSFRFLTFNIQVLFVLGILKSNFCPRRTKMIGAKLMIFCRDDCITVTRSLVSVAKFIWRDTNPGHAITQVSL